MKAEKMPWSQEEIDYVFENWPQGGWRVCRDYFEARGRSYESVRGKADALKLRVVGRDYQKQESTPWIDDCLRREYQNGRPQLKVLARTLARTQGWLKWRAQILGVTRQIKGAPWTEEEDRFLDECLERGLSTSRIYAKFRERHYRRTLSAISSRMRIRNLHWQRNFWTARETAKALGVDNHRVVEWLAQGLLKGKQARGPSADHLPATERKMLWQIKPKSIREFLLNHPHQWDHRKVAKEVLLELLCGGAYGVGSLGE